MFVLKPVVILSPDYVGDPSRVAVGEDYVKALMRSGALPLTASESFGMIDVDELVCEVCHRAAGIMLTGGGDIEADLFNQSPVEGLKGLNRARDEFEIALIRRALEEDMPVLGICRGAQILNVALGGTLVQDIPTQVSDPLPHMFNHDRRNPVHSVSLSDRSILAQIFPTMVVDVNSVHHQAVGDLGAGLSVSAVADDGVIEAVEMYDRQFVLGVQWHPENLAFGEDARWMCLFDRFVDAARRYALTK